MNRRRWLVPVVLLALATGSFLAPGRSSSAAATITVNTSDDELNSDGDCSLREAVEATNTNVPVDNCTAGDLGTDTVVFAPSTDGNPITLASPIVISEALTIDGNGRSATIVQGDEFAVVPGVTTTFRDMTLVLVNNEGGTVSIMNITSTGEVNNNSTGAEVAIMIIENSSLADVNNNSGFGTAETRLNIHESTGGFITNNSGFGTTADLTVSRSTFGGIENNSGGAPPSTTFAFIDNSTINGSGGIQNSAGPGSTTIVTIANTTVTGATGSGIFSDSEGVTTNIDRSRVSGNGENGIRVIRGTSRVTDSTIRGNVEDGILGAGLDRVSRSRVIANGGRGIALVATVTDSTVSGNGAGGIIFAATVSRSTVTGNGGTGIAVGGEVTVTNSTITGNDGTGIFVPDGGGGASVTNSTITRNGGYGMDPFEDFLLRARNSIVFGNRAGDCAERSVGSSGGNIDGDGSCFGLPSDQPNTDPMLGPLAQNGGPTRTQMPFAGSPAIDRAVDCPPPSVDQRGVSRPGDGDGNGVARCDVGSVELAQAVIPTGGVDTGLGGTAPRGWPVVPLVTLGLVLSVVLSVRFLPRRS